MIQVHIADDHRMLVEGLQTAIEDSGIAKVVDTSHTLAACRITLRFRHPDVLLLDISMPDGSGIDFCKEMHEVYPDMKILMLTSYDEYTMVSRAVTAGASGYIQKNALSEEVVKGIETVMAGDTYFSRDIDRMMKKRINHAVWLTVREQELLRHIVDGCTNQEIADRMFLSVLCHSYCEEQLENGESRVVLRLPEALAPVKCAVFPLDKKDGLPEKAREIVNALKFKFNTHYDEKDTIGKRYRRQDAIGTPFCVTVDHDTLKDNCVTLRYRDTMQQERVSIDQLENLIEDKVSITSLLKKMQ